MTLCLCGEGSRSGVGHLAKTRPRTDRADAQAFHRACPPRRRPALRRQRPCHLERRDEILEPALPRQERRHRRAFLFRRARRARKQFAGDIAISASIASQNARWLGHTPAEEIKILALHGILHLRGYDHERDQGRMARREKQLRAKLHLPLGLIERALIERALIERPAPSAARRQPPGSRPRRNP